MKYPKFVYKAADAIKRQRDQYPLIERLRRAAFLRSWKISDAPKSGLEIAAEKALRAEIASLPIEKPDRASNAENKWIRFKNGIREHALHDDPRSFILWPEVRHNMHYVPSLAELRFLKSQPAWPAFEKALEAKGPANIPFYALPSANENAIRQAFHLCSFLKETNASLDDFDQIFEFGGGYGNMCLLVNRLGFKGTYVVFDWPELSALQRYYLTIEGADLSRVRLASDLAKIPGALALGKRTLIIGTWSLSECSPELRERIFQAVQPTHFLIAYQKAFVGVNNEEYFARFQAARPNVAWKTVPIDYVPSERNKYLFGAQR